jgi:hypothetical protein
MPQKKAEEKIPAPRVSTSRVKASGPATVESAGAATAMAKAKPAAKASKATKTTASSATNSLLKLNGAVNGVTSETIAERAYFLWLEKGCPEGTADQDWVEAERQLCAY